MLSAIIDCLFPGLLPAPQRQLPIPAVPAAKGSSNQSGHDGYFSRRNLKRVVLMATDIDPALEGYAHYGIRCLAFGDLRGPQDEYDIVSFAYRGCPIGHFAYHLNHGGLRWGGHNRYACENDCDTVIYGKDGEKLMLVSTSRHYPGAFVVTLAEGVALNQISCGSLIGMSWSEYVQQ